MENATKALYMAVGVIIGILILTAFVFVFRNGGKFLGSLNEQEISKKIEEYNADLVVYQRDNNTIYDVITACNLAYDINKKNDYDNVNYLKIQIDIDGTIYTVENLESLKSGFVKQGVIEISIVSLINKEVDGNKLSALVDETVNDAHNEREYVHTFTGEVTYDEQTGKINLIIFNLN